MLFFDKQVEHVNKATSWKAMERTHSSNYCMVTGIFNVSSAASRIFVLLSRSFGIYVCEIKKSEICFAIKTMYYIYQTTFIIFTFIFVDAHLFGLTNMEKDTIGIYLPWDFSFLTLPWSFRTWISFVSKERYNI